MILLMTSTGNAILTIGVAGEEDVVKVEEDDA